MTMKSFLEDYLIISEQSSFEIFLGKRFTCILLYNNNCQKSSGVRIFTASNILFYDIDYFNLGCCCNLRTYYVHNKIHCLSCTLSMQTSDC